jgi:hypothetical protein
MALLQLVAHFSLGKSNKPEGWELVRDRPQKFDVPLYSCQFNV